MKIEIFLFFLPRLIVGSGALTVDDPDNTEYYWRHYLGTIPKDAVPGGLDENDNVTYIGQTFIDASTVPGEIHDNIKTMFFDFSGPHSTKENIKILCSRYPELFEWIKVTQENYKSLWSKHIVHGGYYHASNTPLLIGRVSHRNQKVVVGDVLPRDMDITLNYIVDGSTHSVKNIMELLSFNSWLRCKDASKHTCATSKTAMEDFKETLNIRYKGRDSDTGCAYKMFNIHFS